MNGTRRSQTDNESGNSAVLVPTHHPDRTPRHLFARETTESDEPGSGDRGTETTVFLVEEGVWRLLWKRSLDGGRRTP